MASNSTTPPPSLEEEDDSFSPIMPRGDLAPGPPLDGNVLHEYHDPIFGADKEHLPEPSSGASSPGCLSFIQDYIDFVAWSLQLD